MPDGADPRRSETATAVAAHGYAESWAVVPPLIRAGGLAGLVAVVLAIGGAVLTATQPSTEGEILAALPLLVLVPWLAAIRAFQTTTLGRLGFVGAWASMLGLIAFGSFKILHAVAAADPTGSFGRLLNSDPVGLVVAAALCLVVWGILALGTALTGDRDAVRVDRSCCGWQAWQPACSPPGYRSPWSAWLAWCGRA